ncbi:MAG: hypothetical protein JNM93_01455 [Bacteriovoracaceae bacterium]|nr:hypothetical protein [Bacteriovoracaceae bacterium]
MKTKNFNFQKAKTRKLNDAVSDFLNEKKIKLSHTEIQKLINEKNIYQKGEQVFLHLPLKLIQTSNLQTEIIQKYDLGPSDILFEDETIILISKPSGQPSQATLDPNRDHIYASVLRYLNDKKPDSYAALLHRLDVETSGVMLFCKKKSFNKNLQTMFEERKIQKTYVAVARKKEGIIPTEWQVNNFLKKMSGKLLKMQTVKSGGDKAITDFKILQQNSDYLLIQATPLTGRTHQIRVHLSESKLPILNDALYGEAGEGRLMLHAWKLNFTHPKTGEAMEVEAPIPTVFKTLMGP